MNQRDKKSNFNLICISTVCLVLFLLVLLCVASNSFVWNIDILVNYMMQGLYSPSLFAFFSLITNIASMTLFVILAALLLGFLFYRKRFKDICFVIYSFGGAAIIEFLLKIVVHRSRPENALIQELDYSFPSGHALKSILFLFVLVYLFKDDIKNKLEHWLLIGVGTILVVLIAFSRIYLRVHWLSDVVGGLLFGAFWFGLMAYLDRNYKICCFENKKKIGYNYTIR